jgi:hypothetical protein
MPDLQFAADQAPGGGERRLGVVEFITIARALDADPSQADDDAFERRQGQIRTRQAEHLTSIEIP